MNWIGQHIYDFISRFRSKVYLEDVANAGSDTDAFLVKKADGEVAIRTGDEVLSDLGVAAGEIIDWTTDQGGTNIHTDNIHDLHGAGVNGNQYSLLTDNGDGSVISNSDLIWQADQLTLISSTSGKPKIALANSNDDAVAPVIEFSKTPFIMADPGDNDEIGKITYTGLDHLDNGQTYANILVHSLDITHSDEAGGMKLQVATEGALQRALTATGDGASSKVDIGLAYGATSLTTIAGDLDIDGDAITTAGDITLDTVGDISLDPHTDKDIFFKENGTERIQWHLDSSPTMEVTGAFDVDGSSDISLDSASGNFKFKQSGNNWGNFDYNTITSSSVLNIGNGTDTGGTATINTTKGTGDFNGKNLTLNGGSCLDGTANNRNGGHVFIKGGGGTGSGRTGEIYFQIKEGGGGSGSSAVESEDAVRIHAETSGTTRNALTVYEPGNDSDEYCRITVADAGVSAIETYDDSGSNGANLTLDIDGDIRIDAHTAKDIYFKENGTERFKFHLDSSPTMEVTGNFDIDGSGDITLDAVGDIALTAAGNDINVDADNFNMTSGTGFRPEINLTATGTAPTKAAQFNFTKNAADTEDGEYLGIINFIGEDEGDNLHNFVKIIGSIAESDDGAEGGRLDFQVANHDGGHESGLRITDGDNDGELDVTIAAGAASLTEIAGDLKVGGEDISGPTDGSLNLHSDAYMRFIIDEDDSGAGAYIWYAKGTPAIDTIILAMAMDGMMDIGGVGTTNPGIRINNYAGDALGGKLIFNKTRGLIATDGQDDDVVGTIEFTSMDDATPNVQTYAKIRGTIKDATDSDEAGKVEILVATEAVLRSAVKLLGDGASSKVDVNLGYGTSSVTTIAGDLDIDGDNVTAEGALTITPGGAFSVAGGSSEIDLTTSGTVDVNAGTLDIDATNVYITGTSNLIEGKTSIPRRQFQNVSDGAGNADGDVIWIGTNDGGGGGAATTAGKVYYYHSNGSWVATNSDDPGTATGLLAVALGTAPSTHGMLLRGTVDLADNIVGTEALGSILYLDKATAGAVTTAAPTATGDIVRVIGYALSVGDTNKIWFNPDNTWVEHV